MKHNKTRATEPPQNGIFNKTVIVFIEYICCIIVCGVHVTEASCIIFWLVVGTCLLMNNLKHDF